MRTLSLILLISLYCLSCTSENKTENKYFCKAITLNFEGRNTSSYFYVDQEQFHKSDSCSIDSIYYEYLVAEGDTFQHLLVFLYPEFSKARIFRFDNEGGNLKRDTLHFLELPRSEFNGKIGHEMYNVFKKSWRNRFSYRYWIWFDSTKSNSKIDSLRMDYYFYNPYLDSSYIFKVKPCLSSRIKVDK